MCETPIEPKKNYKSKLTFILFAFAMAGIVSLQKTYADVRVKSDISQDAIWTQELSPYIITRDTTVEEGVILKIEPGAKVVFETSANPSKQGYFLKVDGTLRAQGADNNPIIFTAEDTDNPWGAIAFTEISTGWDSSSDTGSVLENVIIEYGGVAQQEISGEEDSADRLIYGDAAIRIFSSAPLIRNNIIRYSAGHGILASQGNLHVSGNQIHDCNIGIIATLESSGTIEHNYLLKNNQGIFIESSNGLIDITNNTILSESELSNGNCIELNLTQASDRISYLWEQISGTSVTLSNENGAQPTFSPPDINSNETLRFRLTLSDDLGLQASDTVSVNVIWENQPPVTDASSDQFVYPESVVLLDGSGSSDVDDGIFSYSWVQTAGPTVDLTGDTSVHSTFTVPAVPTAKAGDQFVFQLIVEDQSGQQSIDTIVITVIESNESPQADAGAEQVVSESVLVTLDGTGSSDSGGNIVYYLWEQISGTDVTLYQATSSQLTFTSPAVDASGDSLEFKLTVTDDDSAKSSDKVFVNVIGASGNNPPTADASGDQTVDEGDTVTLDGADSTDDVALAGSSYYWEQISGPTITLLGSGQNPKTFTAPIVEPYTELVFRLTVTDSEGMKSADKAVVTVMWENDEPVADAGPDQIGGDNPVAEGARVTLDGSGSTDPDDGINSYQWLQTGGPVVTLTNSTIEKPIFIAPDVSSDTLLVFELTVADSGGLEDKDAVVIEVLDDNQIPVADAGPNQSAQVEDVVILDGSGSSDPEGDVLQYLWVQTDGLTIILVDPETDSPTFTAPGFNHEDKAYETLKFEFTVKDAYGLSDSDAVTVTIVQDGSTAALVADAGQDQTADADSIVTLNARSSFDPNMISLVNIRNNQLNNDVTGDSGNTLAISGSQSAVSDVFINSNNLIKDNGDYQLYLSQVNSQTNIAIDIDNNWWGTADTGKIDQMIYDYDLNNTLIDLDYSGVQTSEIAGIGSDRSYPPIADAGEDQTASPDDTVVLDASGAYDPDGLLTYIWEQISGPEVNLYNANRKKATFVSPSGSEDDNIMKFKSTVTDANGFYDTDEIRVTIESEEEDDEELRESAGCFINSVF